MALKLITDAATEPVTLAEAKLFIRYTASLQDAVITSMITTATKYVQNWCNTQLVNATFEYYTDTLYGEIWFPLGPISSISAITYQDLDDNQQTLATSIYGTDFISPINKVFLKVNQTYPLVLNEPNTVKISLIAGYGAAASNVPEHYKTLIKTIVGAYFENREGLTEMQLKAHPSVDQLLNLGTQNYRF